MEPVGDLDALAVVLRERLLSESAGDGSGDVVGRIRALWSARVRWVERAGRLVCTEVRVASVADLRDVIERFLAPVGRRVDEAEPLCGARLPEHSSSAVPDRSRPTSPTLTSSLQTRSAHHSQRARVCGFLDAGQ